VYKNYVAKTETFDKGLIYEMNLKKEKEEEEKH
jgi:hypothetical protein